MDREELKRGLRLIDHIEFHEVRMRYGTGIEVRFYVSDVTAFIEWCNQERWEACKRMWKHELAFLARSRAKRPHFKWHRPTECVIYPKENLVTKQISGLHYVCQHAFDVLPSEAKGIFYNSEKPFSIGTLFTRKKEDFDVTSRDIATGVGLSYNGTLLYGQKFTKFIRHRKEQ